MKRKIPEISYPMWQKEIDKYEKNHLYTEDLQPEQLDFVKYCFKNGRVKISYRDMAAIWNSQAGWRWVTPLQLSNLAIRLRAKGVL